MKTTRQSWLSLANAYAVEGRKTETQKDIRKDGLCYAIYHHTLFRGGMRSEIDQILYMFSQDMDKTMSEYWVGFKEQDSNTRSLFCCLMAELSTEEHEELLP